MNPYIVIDTNTNTRTTNEVDSPPSIDIKWPALIVTGKSVTPDQARDIIFRTHPSYYYCNDDTFTDMVLDAYGVAPLNPESFMRYIGNDVIEHHGIISLEYLSNSRIASSWVGGVHGWIDWDGTIGTSNYNIGKWPSLEEVLSDLECIVKAFPYLEMQVQILNHESGYLDDSEVSEVTAQFDIKDGVITVFRPDTGSEQLVQDTFPSFLSFACGSSHMGHDRFKREFARWKEYRTTQAESK